MENGNENEGNVHNHKYNFGTLVAFEKFPYNVRVGHIIEFHNIESVLEFYKFFIVMSTHQGMGVTILKVPSLYDVMVYGELPPVTSTICFRKYIESSFI